jgi:hypothetical protein
MERQRQRRLLAELRLGPGWQRSLSDYSRRGVRELERKLTENSRLSFFEISVQGAEGSEKVDRLVVKTIADDSPKAHDKSGGS